jgi:hypothetical protein
MDDCVQGDEGNSQIRCVRSDAVRAGTQNRVHAMEALQGAAAGGRLALVTRAGWITEIAAARALKEVPTNGCHISQLDRGTEQKCLVHNGQAIHDDRISDYFLH